MERKQALIFFDTVLHDLKDHFGKSCCLVRFFPRD